MMYKLVIGIRYRKYKSPAIIKIFVGQKFLDEFEIDDNYDSPVKDLPKYIDEQWYKKYNKPHWVPKNNDYVNWFPNLFKIYDINDDELVENIEIQVLNSNNDYNNGFMANNSLIKFPIIGLVPSHICKHNGRQLMKNLIRFTGSPAKSIYKKDWRLFDNSDKKKRIKWPTVSKVYVTRTNEKWNKSEIYNLHSWFGGDFNISIPIGKKHGTKYLSEHNKKEIGFPHYPGPTGLLMGSLRPLLNIYNENK